MTIFCCVDLETTGLDPENDAIVEIACIDVEGGTISEKPRSSLVKSPIPIPPQSSAIHHITDFDIAYANTARDIIPQVLSTDRGPIYVAHNAKFKSEFLKPYIPDSQWLCTYKAALRIYPDAPGHSVQVLRYFLDLKVDRAIADMAHRALPDAYVTAHILVDLMSKASAADMLAWTLEPARLPVCPIGKEWRGKPWAEIDIGFLTWMIGQKDMEADLIWNARFELHKRSEAQRPEREKWVKIKRDAYVQAAPVAIKTARTLDDLNRWWKDSQEHFAIHKIEKGDDDYNKLRDACAARKADLMQSTEQAA